MSLEQLLSEVQKYHPNPDLLLLEKAYRFAEKAHSGQLRASGEPYFIHLVETALIACKLRLDIPSVSAALLHDTIEDCDVTAKQLEEEFSPEIAHIVEGVSRLTRLEFVSREEEQIESFRKLLIAMAQDIRVVLIKLCDRLHNMRTLEFVPESKQRRKATESKEIYAPLANRLGLHWMKSEIEDLCLRYLRPELYSQFVSRFEETKEDREAYIKRTTGEIAGLLEEAGISASVKGRAKHFFSIWQKMERDNITFDEINDLLGFRIIVPTIRACYEALGVMHSAWKPVPGRFKDYIAMPKPNMYQSLHTTVIGPEGRRIELQIRTPEMNRIAEDGVAAHWRYKEGGDVNKGFDLQWVRDLVETQEYLKNPEEFIQSVKGELFPEEVFVFTPRGDLIRLPYGSTPLDFAYAVHTDIGNTTTGAKVNGSIIPLSHKLENGDTVEVITSKNQSPSKDWLAYVKSTKAKQRIRAFLRTQEQAHSMAIGMELLAKDLRKLDITLKKLEKSGKLRAVAKDLGLKTEGALYAEIGYGKITSYRVISKLAPEMPDIEERLKPKESRLGRIVRSATVTSRQKHGVRVSGMDDMLVRFAKCCEPLPGDRIVGFITRGRGVTIHNASCPQVLANDPQRRLEVNWDGDIKGARRVRIIVTAQDQRGLLAKLSKAVTDAGADIKSAAIKTTETAKAIISFEIELLDSAQYRNIVRGLEMVAGVIKVERITKWDGGK
jgi:GTP diphosphokinase / guanosine-3',5'-bis(diphosphate) 3'-diphosphatase